jgi:hypothetical protein
LAKKRKKTPKNSNKRNRKSKEKQENIIILSIFLVFIVIIGYLFYFLNIQSSSKDAVATVNGKDITRDELDWWYKVSILPEFSDLITKQDFLVLSLIPQEVLMQEAEKENIKVTKDEVEQLLGIFIIENGLTLDEFERDLESSGLTINDVKKSFETRTATLKLLEEKNIGLIGKGENLFFDENDNTFQEYVDSLMENSDIEIFQENIEKLVLRSFEETNDEVCGKEKPIIRLYTTSSCQVCKESGILFQDLVINLIGDGSVQARHWSLDTGDNLLTLKKENGVPKEEVALFKKYSPNKLVPTIVLGCKYKHVGKFGVEEQDEFKTILKTLIGG